MQFLLYKFGISIKIAAYMKAASISYIYKVSVSDKLPAVVLSDKTFVINWQIITVILVIIISQLFN